MARPQTVEDLVAQRFSKNFEKYRDAIVARRGPPPASERLSAAREDALWSYTDPKVDRDQLASQLLQTGLPPELLHPDSPQALDIVKEQPDLIAALAQKAPDAETADMLARMVQTPFRWGLLANIDDPDEMVRKSDALDRRYQMRHQAPAMPALDGQPSAADATMPEPPMPAEPMMPLEGGA